MVVRKHGRASNIKAKWHEFHLCRLLGPGIFAKATFDFTYSSTSSLKIFSIVQQPLFMFLQTWYRCCINASERKKSQERAMIAVTVHLDRYANAAKKKTTRSNTVNEQRVR